MPISDLHIPMGNSIQLFVSNDHDASHGPAPRPERVPSAEEAKESRQRPADDDRMPHLSHSPHEVR